MSELSGTVLMIELTCYSNDRVHLFYFIFGPLEVGINDCISFKPDT